MAIQNISDIKSVLGNGYRTNYFTVDFKFNIQYELLYTYLSEIINTLKNKQSLDFKILKSSSQDQAYNIPAPKGSSNNQINNIIDKFLYDENNNTWYTMAKAFQFPGLTVDETEEIIKSRRCIKEITNGAMTSTILNDRFGLSYDFWRIYLRILQQNNQLRYPSEYEFNVNFTTVLDMQNRVSYLDTKIKKYTFYDCYVKGTPDLDYNMDNTEAHQFDLEFSFEDYDERTETVTSSEFFSNQFSGTLFNVGNQLYEQYKDNDLKSKINNIKSGINAKINKIFSI